MDSTIMVATAGQGILRSNDAGSTWHRLGLGEAIEFDGVVRALAVDPMRPARVYAGADAGLCISDDGGAHWRRADSAMNGMTVWSIAIDPSDASVLYAGTGAPSRAALFKSTDAGASWARLPPEIPEFCAGVNAMSGSASRRGASGAAETPVPTGPASTVRARPLAMATSMPSASCRPRPLRPRPPWC